MTATFMWESDEVVRGRLRISLAVVAAVAVAEIAVLVLRPNDGVIKPADVQVSAYFSDHQVDRAQDFRQPQLWLYGVTLAIQAGVLVLLVARPPRALKGAFRRPLLAAALTGAAISVAVNVAPLPVQLIMRERAKDVGLVTQPLGGYFEDVGKSLLLGGALAGGGAALAIVLMRRLPRTWWIPGAAIVFAFGVGTIYAGPVVVDPLFNRFEDAPPAVRADVMRIAERAGVKVGDVLSVDASQRTTAVNAYVTGIGSTKRVVLYDNLTDDFDRRQLNVVVAHELSHVKHNDIRTGLLFLLIVAPVGMWAVAEVTRKLGPEGAAGAQTLPALAAAIALVVTPMTLVSNQLSRGFEAHADSAALRITDDPQAAIEFHKRLALRNVSDPDPPKWVSFVFGTHPTTLDRIGIAKAYEEHERRASRHAPH